MAGQDSVEEPLGDAGKAHARDAELAEADVLGERVAAAQEPDKMPGQRDDRGDLERQPQILDLTGKVSTLLQHDAGAIGEAVQADKQFRRRPRSIQRFDIGACGGERIERDIDPV